MTSSTTSNRSRILFPLVIIAVVVACTNPPSPTPPTSRTGIAYVDAVIDAGESGDPQALKRLVFFSTFPCTTGEGFGGPPKCLPGEPEATLVEALPVLGSEGGHVRMDEIDEWEGIGAAKLYGVYRTGSETYSDEFFPSGEFAVVFIPAGSEIPLTLQVTQNGIIRFDQGFRPTLEELLREHGSDFVLGPFFITD